MSSIPGSSACEVGAKPLWRPHAAGVLLGLGLLLTFVLTGHGLGGSGFTTALAAKSAQVVAPATSTDKVQIGSWVTFANEQDEQQRIQLVGEDQADANAGLINWGSPLGRALLGAQVGDEVLWQRPVGDQLIEVLRIEAET